MSAEDVAEHGLGEEAAVLAEEGSAYSAEGTSTSTSTHENTDASSGETPSSTQADAKRERADFYTDVVATPFYTGIDITTSAEQEKRARRAQRFGMEVVDHVAEAHGTTREELEKRAARAKRFPGSSSTGADGSGAEEDGGSSASSTSTEEANEFPSIFFHDDAALRGIPEKEVEAETSAFDPQAERRWNVIHLFGSKMIVDNLKTAETLKMFSSYGPQRVEWISDYRCNVVFGDSESAKRALFVCSKSFDSNVTASLNYIMNNGLNVSYAVEDVPFVVWREASRIGHSSKSSLALRVATVLDVKATYGNREPSQYYKRNHAYHAKLVETRRRQARKEEQASKAEARALRRQQQQQQQGDAGSAGEDAEGEKETEGDDVDNVNPSAVSEVPKPIPVPVGIISRDGQVSRLTKAPPSGPSMLNTRKPTTTSSFGSRQRQQQFGESGGAQRSNQEVGARGEGEGGEGGEGEGGEGKNEGGESKETGVVRRGRGFAMNAEGGILKQGRHIIVKRADQGYTAGGDDNDKWERGVRTTGPVRRQGRGERHGDDSRRRHGDDGSGSRRRHGDADGEDRRRSRDGEGRGSRLRDEGKPSTAAAAATAASGRGRGARKYSPQRREVDAVEALVVASGGAAEGTGQTIQHEEENTRQQHQEQQHEEQQQEQQEHGHYNDDHENEQQHQQHYTGHNDDDAVDYS